jgi:uncharacterized protein (TIGR03437 family)
MKRLKSLSSGVLVVALAMLGFSHTAFGQYITVTPGTDPKIPLSFNNVPVGAISDPQNITVSTVGATTLVLQAPNTPWLVFPGGLIYQTSPLGVRIPVEVSAAGLVPGTYSGSFNITISQYIAVTVYVSMTVSGTVPTLAAYPSSLFFSAQQGAYAATPASAAVTITSTGTAIDYTLQTQVQAGDPNWIVLSSTTGTTGYSGFIVQANPYGLPAGRHYGSITAFSTTTNDSETISVTLTINPTSVLSVTPATPTPILWLIGSYDPPAQQFIVTSTGGAVAFTVRLSPLVSWAAVSPFSGTAGLATPATVGLTLRPSLLGLRPGTYTTSLIVTPAGGLDLPAVPITLIATGYPFLQLSTTSLAFSAQFGSGQAPPDQQVAVAAPGGGAVGFTIYSDSPWLRASASSATTPSILTVHVNPFGLPVGMVTGNLTIFPTNGDTYMEAISVTLMVVSSSQVSVGPSQLLFSYQAGSQPPRAQTVQVRNSGLPVSFSVATVTTSCGGNWLTATPSSYVTPATLSVSVATYFAPGVCQGIVAVNYNSGSGPGTALVNVTLALSNQSELTVNMPAGFGDETAQQGAAAYARQVFLSSTDFATPVSFSALASNLSGGPWLGVTGINSGLTPRTLTIQVNPSAVPGPGFYAGNLVISSASLPNGSITIPITLTVTPTVAVSVSPTSLSFSQVEGGPAPAAQTLTLASGGAATFMATIPQITGGTWLRVSPSSGQANGYLQVSVLSNSLSQGDYPAQIVLVFQNSATSPVTVNVTLHVGPPPKTVSVSPQSLSFFYQMGGSPPASQQIGITSTGGAVSFMVGVSSTGWLSTDVNSGTTPAGVGVLVNTQGLTVAGGPYMGSITISAAGVLANPISIKVTLTVTALPAPMPMTVSNNASGAFGVIAPGELITIKGSALGPAAPAAGVTFSINPQGNVDSTLAGVRVLFSNIPGTPVFVSPGQINVITPYEIEGRTSANIVVEYQGTQSAPIPVVVADDAPGLYTNDSSGTGQVTAANDNGTLNGPAGVGYSPAAPGSVLTVYATGFGQTAPHSITGSVTPMPHTAADLLHVNGTMAATIGGQPAAVMFAGAAPGMVTGVVQLNIKVPNGVAGDHLPISVSVNGKSTPGVGTTVAVQ